MVRISYTSLYSPVAQSGERRSSRVANLILSSSVGVGKDSAPALGVKVDARNSKVVTASHEDIMATLMNA